jgi:ATP-binding cassette subfamily C protein CydD/ATP-binding cassette subfamily C protein CydCD
VIAAHERPAGVVFEHPSAAGPRETATLPAAGHPLALRTIVDRRLLAGAALGALALLAGVALTATSGWLIAKASQQPPILTLTVAVVGVRAFGLARASLRYAERLTTHDAAFRVAGRLRVRLWTALVRRGPAEGFQAGEGQLRLVGDVDTVRDLLPRTVTPPLVAALVGTGAVMVQTAVLPSAGLALAVAVLLGGLAAPLLALRFERRATAALAVGRRSVSAQVLGLFESAAELIAYGAHAGRRRTLADTDARLVADAQRQAFGSGAAEALITLVSGAAAIAGTDLAAHAVAAERLDPQLAPLHGQ